MITTDRLVLRAHRRTDLDAAVAMWSDPLVTRFIGGKPSTPQQSWARILGYRGHWTLMHFGYWAIEDRATHAYVGDIGFADFHRAVAPAMRDVPELGWALVAAFHGRGLATEAARAALAWGDSHFAGARTVCMIDPGNTASLRVAGKCGFSVFERTTYNDLPTLFLERLQRPELRASR